MVSGNAETHKLQYISTITKEIDTFCILFSIKITDYLMMLLAREAYEVFINESVLDVCQAIRNGASGKHGTTYNTINPAIINEWVKLHLEQKYEARETELLKYKQEKYTSPEVDYEAYKKRMDNDQDKIDKTVKLIRKQRQKSNE